jgi:hypothetical protein
MEINTAQPKRTVWDFDIVSVNGTPANYTVDPSAGDTFEYVSDRLILKLSERPSVTDSDLKIAEEEVVILLPNTFAIRKRKRETTDLTAEQREELKAWIKAQAPEQPNQSGRSQHVTLDHGPLSVNEAL